MKRIPPSSHTRSLRYRQAAGARTLALQNLVNSCTVHNPNKSSAVAEMGDHGHNRHGSKIGWGLVCIFSGGSWVPIEQSNTNFHKVAWAEAYLHTKWLLDASSRLATIKIRPKLGGSAPFLGRGAGSPSSTMWPGPRPTSVPSAILIHPAVWPQ